VVIEALPHECFPACNDFDGLVNTVDEEYRYGRHDDRTQ
jgi:hypothetical protein